MRKIKIALLILVITFLSGCGGRAANPVMVNQYGDEKKSCKALVRELTFIESEVARLVPETHKTGTNTLLGVTGAIFIVPLFFLDFSKAEQTELNALRRRYNHIVILADEKDCGLKKEEIPDFKEKPGNEAKEEKTS